MTRGLRLFGRIHQAQIDDADAWFLQPLGDLLRVSRQALLQSFKLRPVRVESNSEEPYREFVGTGVLAHVCMHSPVMNLR